MSRPAAAAALLLVAACASPPPPLNCTAVAVPGARFVPIGVPVTVPAAIAVSCFGGDPNRPSLAGEVSVEVFDPDNRRAPFTASAPVRTGGPTRYDVETQVTFTAGSAGTWTVIARFDPGLGQAQLELRTIEVRKDAGFREVPTALPTDCTLYALTASGVPVCTRPGGGPLVELAVGDQRFTGESFAVDGETFWRLALTRSQPPPAIERISPGATGAYDVSHVRARSSPGIGSRVGLTAYDGVAHCTTTGDGVYERLVPLSDGGIRFDEVDIPGGRFAKFAAPGPDGVLVLANGGGGGPVAFFAPDGGLSRRGVSHDTEPFAHGGGVLWVSEQDTSLGFAPRETLAGFDVRAGALRHGSLAIQTVPGVPLPLSPQAPVVRIKLAGGSTLAVVPVMAEDALGFDVFEPGPGYGEIVSATPAHAFARSTDGKTLKIFDR